MQELVRHLPALSQIALALQYRGYQVIQMPTAAGLLISHPSHLQLRLRLRYLEAAYVGSQNQLLELQVPLRLQADPAQLLEIATLLASFNGNLKGLSLAFGNECLVLRNCQLHPKQLPDLRSILRLIQRSMRIWNRLHSMLTAYLRGQLTLKQLQEQCP